MRILFVIPRLISYEGFLRELCLSLREDGHQVHVACSGVKLWSEEDIHDEGVRMHVVEFPRGMNPLAHIRAARALQQVVAAVEPDVVHAHFSAAIFTTALARRRDWPTTFGTFHGVSFLAMNGWRAALLRVAETWAAGRFETAWVLTDDDRRGLQAAARKAVVRRVSGYGLGCDLQRFVPPDSSARAALRRQLGFADDDVVFAFVGRFVEFKGFALVVRAFLEVAEFQSNVQLLLIGGRDRLHASGLSQAEEKALAASGRVVDLGFRADVERQLPAADVMVFPSRREGMPVCLMEALALGIPVITSASRGCREVVRHRVDGLVLSVASTEALRAAMHLLVQDKALRLRLAACARAGSGRFDRNQFIEEQKRLLAEIPARRAARAPALVAPQVAIQDV